MDPPDRSKSAVAVSRADYSKELEALFLSIQNKVDLGGVPYQPSTVAAAVDFEGQQISALAKNKEALRGSISDYKAAAEKSIAEKDISNSGAILSLWLDADQEAAITFLEANESNLSKQSLRLILRTYYRDHGSSGFKELVGSSDKLQGNLAAALVMEDPVFAVSLIKDFSNDEAVSFINKNAFSKWPPDQRDKALVFMTASLGQRDFVNAFQEIGLRLDIQQLLEWATSCSQAPGLPEAYKRSVLGSSLLKKAYLDSSDLEFWERTNGIANTLSKQGYEDSTQWDPIIEEAARQIIRHDSMSYLRNNPDIKGLYHMGSYSAQQLLDEITNSSRFDPEFRQAAEKELFKILAPINPADALNLLSDLPSNEKQTELLKVAGSLSFSDYTLEDVAALIDALPGNVPASVGQNRDALLRKWVNHTLAVNGPTFLQDWLQSTELGDSRETLERLISSQ